MAILELKNDAYLLTLKVNLAGRIKFTVDIENADVSTIVLKYRKPDNNTGTFSSVTYDGGEYYVDVPVDTLDVEGVWTFWAYINNSYSSDPFMRNVKAEGYELVSPTFVKAVTGIGETHNTILPSLIRLCVNDYLTIRNAPFDTDENGNTLYPPGSDITVSRMVGWKIKNITNDEYRSIKSERIGDYSVTFEKGITNLSYPETITSSIKRLIDGT